MVGANDRAVDHLECVLHCPAFVQGVHDLLPEPRQCPTPKLPVNAGPLPELCREVPPRGSGARNPENAIQNKAVVGRFASVRGADYQDEPLKERPFLVRHQVSCQAGLHRRYQLESRSACSVNPFCQHGLALIKVEQDLIECDFGSLEGKSIKDSMNEYGITRKEQLAEILPNDGEPWSAVLKRCKVLLAKITAVQRFGSTVVLVGHDAVLQGISETLTGHWFQSEHGQPHYFEKGPAGWAVVNSMCPGNAR